MIRLNMNSIQHTKPQLDINHHHIIDYHVNMNPTFEDITLNQVDCELFQNIIHYDFDRISFDFDFVRMFGYDNVDLGLSFGVKLDQLRIKCPNVKVVIDSEFIWDAEFASVIQNSVIQTSL